MTRCSEGMRHWFTYYGWVGSSSPVCRRCHAPNPNYDPDRDVRRTGFGRMSPTEARSIWDHQDEYDEQTVTAAEEVLTDAGWQ